MAAAGKKRKFEDLASNSVAAAGGGSMPAIRVLHGFLPDGSQYEYRGEHHDNLPCGRGTMIVITGSDLRTISGRFERGLPHGQSNKVEHNNGDSYKGNMQNGQFHGYGKLNESSGIIYDGEWLNGKRHGRGLQNYPEGIRYHSVNAHLVQYDGEWKIGKANGFGQLQWTSGRSYTGHFVDGHPDGMGTYQGAGGDNFCGTFKRSQQVADAEHPGVWTRPSGSRFLVRFDTDCAKLWNGGTPAEYLGRIIPTAEYKALRDGKDKTIAELEEKLAVAGTDKDNLQQDNASKDKCIAAYKALRDAKDKTITELEAKLAVAGREKDKLQQDNATKDKSIAAMHAKLALVGSWHESIAELEAKLAVAGREKDKLQKDNATKDKSIAELHAQLAVVGREKDKLQKEHRDNAALLQERDARLQFAVQRKDHLEESIAQLRGQNLSSLDTDSLKTLLMVNELAHVKHKAAYAIKRAREVAEADKKFICPISQSRSWLSPPSRLSYPFIESRTLLSSRRLC